MCGIFGVIDLQQKLDVDIEFFNRALRTMIHRGPNDQSVSKVDANCMLGHVRLSIIDIGIQSNQPFVDNSNRWHLVFNGEIYNYLELREELMLLGCLFYTQSDTEVLLNAYIIWGEECVKRFNGMWAFVIYDSKDKTVFCSRDRFGVKPFYYANIGSLFVFASELKPIISLFPKLRHPDLNSITNYIYDSSIADSENTWFKEIRRLLPSHNCFITKDYLSKNRYWYYPREKFENPNKDELISEYRELFEDAVKIRMRSDVPIGITLSSGVDSNSILFSIPKVIKDSITAYSVSVRPGDYSKVELKNFKTTELKNEACVAEKMAQLAEMEFTPVEFDYNEYCVKLKHIIYHMECGHHSFAVMPYYFLMKSIKNNSVVILEGQGSDEMLGGYYGITGPIFILQKFQELRFFAAIKEFFELRKSYKSVGSIMRLIKALRIGVFEKIYNKFYLDLDNIVTVDLKKVNRNKSENVLQPDLLTRILQKQHQGLLVDFLHYGDTLSMAHSLESRLPFMDYRLIEFVFKLPSDYLVGRGMGKLFHREAMNGIVPDEILQEKIKLGFNVPMSTIFNSTASNSPLSILTSERCLNRGFFKKKGILKLFDNLNRSHSHIQLMYKLLSIELWFRLFIDGDDVEGLEV